MAVKYGYICNKCLHEWKVGYKILNCPKCGSVDIDIEYTLEK